MLENNTPTDRSSGKTAAENVLAEFTSHFRTAKSAEYRYEATKLIETLLLNSYHSRYFIRKQKFLHVINSTLISEKICKLTLHRAGGHDGI